MDVARTLHASYGSPEKAPPGSDRSWTSRSLQAYTCALAFQWLRAAGSHQLPVVKHTVQGLPAIPPGSPSRRRNRLARACHCRCQSLAACARLRHPHLCHSTLAHTTASKKSWTNADRTQCAVVLKLTKKKCQRILMECKNCCTRAHHVMVSTGRELLLFLFVSLAEARNLSVLSWPISLRDTVLRKLPLVSLGTLATKRRFERISRISPCEVGSSASRSAAASARPL